MMFVTKKEVKKHFRFVHSTKKEKLKGNKDGLGYFGHLILKLGHLGDFGEILVFF